MEARKTTSNDGQGGVGGAGRSAANRADGILACSEPIAVGTPVCINSSAKFRRPQVLVIRELLT